MILEKTRQILWQLGSFILYKSVQMVSQSFFMYLIWEDLLIQSLMVVIAHSGY